MKYKILFIISIFSFAFVFNACKKASSTEPVPESTDNFFPNANGNYYKYSLDRTDSTGTQSPGTRSATYQDTKMIDTTMYQVQVDTITIAGLITTKNLSYFRKSPEGTGIFYYLDTTGLSSAVPADYLQYLSFDKELRLFTFPFKDGGFWPVFKMNLNYGPITLTVVDVTAYYQGMEDITLNLTSGSVSRQAAKIRYVFKLTIPNPQNILAPPLNKQFEATAWVVNDIGIARWQGNGTILGVFAGSGINFADTSSVVSQSLIGYSIK